jgi:hypothetical protein
MNSTTSLPRLTLATRAISRVARWQRRISARLQAGDEFARQAGWTITRTRFGGRIYRDPRLDHLTAAPAPGTPREVAPPAAGPAAASSRHQAGTGHQQATMARPARRNRNGGTDDRQHP